STVLSLNTLVAEDVKPEVKSIMGPFGEVAVLAKSNQLILQDTVKSIKNILKTVEDIEKNEARQGDNFTHVCVWVKARDAERMLKDLMGDPKLLAAQIAAASMPMRDPRDGRPIMPTQPPAKVRMFYIAADERSNTVIVTGSPDKIAQARELM